MEAVVIYWSKTGNTRKVAFAIQEGLKEAGVDAEILTVEEADNIDYFKYDLVCIGFPSHQWSPAGPMNKFLTGKFSEYRKQGLVKWGSPALPGKNALIFCTYSGPHTGVNEAKPAGLYAGQFFEHLGFNIVGDWYVVGEFHGSEEASTLGRLGDIRGLPNEEDLKKVRVDAAGIVKKIKV